jgi:DoxX-like family
MFLSNLLFSGGYCMPLVPVSKAALWTGRVMSALPVLLVLFGSVVKLMKTPSVIEGFAHSGLPASLIVPVGIIEMICVVVYVIPQTSVLGAILMTGLLGGAAITGLRIGDPSVPLPLILGMLAWGGLYLRDVRLRALIPLRRAE